MYLSIKTNLNEELAYLFSSQSEMKVNGFSLIQSNTEQKMAYTLREKDSNEAYSIALNVLSSNVNLPKEAGNTLFVSQLLNVPYDKLILKLYSNGELQSVINQAEITKIWEAVKKKEEFKSLLDRINEKKLTQELDLGYIESLRYLREMSNYIVFFIPVYRLLYDTSHFARYDQNSKSILFVGNTIRFKIHLWLHKVENGIACFRSRLLKFDTNESDMKKLYKTGYGAIVKSELDYQFLYEAEHWYNLSTGLLIQAKALFEEQANKDLIYRNKIDINLKTSEL